MDMLNKIIDNYEWNDMLVSKQGFPFAKLIRIFLL